MPLVAWLLGMVSSLVGRVLLALGMSVVTIVGFEAAIGTLKNAVSGGANALPVDVLNLFLLAGGGAAINIIFGAISFRVTLWVIQKSTKVLGVSA
ncbi:MAG: DUF2523 domain-containing protein [Aeromicrobium sp.]|uniref:DUF2523 domain-containing protein n=1 Tax=Aeromicrobium sp. TaxID=1871063 RepID=UPI0039E5221C